MDRVKLLPWQDELLRLWLNGSGSPRMMGLATGARMPIVRQLVRRGLLATQSTLPFAGRRQSLMTLYLTDAGRAALETSDGKA